jgi:predicted NAD-dependent protein-ADP-ribosyltransferase YbiA (DUF1768 family)
MVAVAEAFYFAGPHTPSAFSMIQLQWFNFLTIDRWLLHSELEDSRTIVLSSLPPQSYIAYLGTATPGVDRLQEDNNGFGGLSNYYTSGENNPNSFIQEPKSEAIPLIVRYGSQNLAAFSVETLYHLHKMVLVRRFQDVEDVKTFSQLSPDKAKKSCRRAVKKIAYNESDVNIHMFQLLRQKYTTNEVLGKLFLSTKHYLLFEGNKWNDPLWGICFTNSTQFSGVNKLGKILARMRRELRYNYTVDVTFRNFIDGKRGALYFGRPSSLSRNLL